MAEAKRRKRPAGDLADVPRYATYARVSTDEQAEKGTIDGQRAFLDDFARLYGLDVVAAFADDGISGATPLGERPDGLRLLEGARAGAFNVALVYRLDRLGRSLRALLDAHDALDAAGVTIRSATEPFDTATSIGKFLFQLLASLAELERSTITDRLTMGRDRVWKTGRLAHGAIPFGYDLDAEGRVVPSERPTGVLGQTEADVARSVFAAIADGATTMQEARRLTGLGVPARRRWATGTERPTVQAWTFNRIWRMVQNPVYTGLQVLNSRNGRLERAVPPLVDAALWERVQQRLVANRQMSRKPDARAYLLRGLVRCGDCGTSYTGSGSRRDRLAYYAHMLPVGALRTLRTIPCRGRYVPAAWLEDLVWERCRAEIREPEPFIAAAQAALRARTRTRRPVDPDRRGRLERLIAAKSAERERVMTLFRRGLATLEETEQQLSALAAETDRLREERAAVATQAALATAAERDLAERAVLLRELRAEFAEIEQDPARKRRAIEQLVTGIEVRSSGSGRRKVSRIRVTTLFGAHDAAVPRNVVGLGRAFTA